MIVLGYSGYSQAQLILQDIHGQDITNQTVLVEGLDTDNTITYVVKFSNTGEDNVHVFVRKIEDYVVEGSFITFCWNGTCVDPGTTEVASPIILSPGETSTSGCFYSELTPFGVMGESVVTYEFYDEGNSFETVSVTITYQVDKPTPVYDLDHKAVRLGNASPNPAAGFTQISYELPRNAMQASLVVRNLVGNVVHTQHIDPANNRVQLDTSNFPNGIYIYSLTIDNQVIQTKRLVVAR